MERGGGRQPEAERTAEGRRHGQREVEKRYSSGRPYSDVGQWPKEKKKK